MELKLAQHSWSAGEVGDLDFRSDLPLYNACAKRIVNRLVLPQGGLLKRPGFQYIASLAGFTRIIQFKFSTDQQYVMAFAPSKLRIFRNDVLVYSNDSCAWTAGHIAKMRWIGEQDSVFVVSQDGTLQPQRIARQGSDSSWAVGSITFDALPHANFNTGRTVTPSATSGSITLTLAGTSPFVWTGGHVGSVVRGNSGVATITSISSGTVANATVNTNFANTNAIPSSEWRLTAWSSGQGWPRTITVHQNRFVYGGSRDLPQTIWFSRVSDFFRFQPVDANDVKEDDAMDYTIGADEVNTLVDLYSGRGLEIFTNSGEFIEDSQPLTPLNINIRRQTAVGMIEGGIRVQHIDNETLYITKDGKQLCSYSYAYDRDQYTAKSYTTVANQILDVISSPLDMIYLRSFANTQANYLFITKADGVMAVLSIETSRDVLAWSRLITEGSFKSVCTVNGALYALIDRNGSTFLEKMWDSGVYLDHWYTGTDPTPTATWSGLTTLAGRTVEVMGDSFHYVGINVDGSGQFVLPEPVSDIQAGHPYTAPTETMVFDTVIGGQRTRGELVRKLRAYIMVKHTKDLWIDGREVPSRMLGLNLLDQPLPEHQPAIDWRLSGISRAPTLVIDSRRPLPQTLLGINVTIKVRA